MSEKLQKILANAGFGSRREMEQWISDGRVSVNGTTATLGDRATVQDKIMVDGNALKRQAESDICRVIMYNKPEGEVCSRNDPEGRPTVFDRMPRISQGRWISVGRLDLNTSGLLLLTNDGELANRLMHPRHEIEREYRVRVFGEVSDKTLHVLKKGVELEDGMARFRTIKRDVNDADSMNAWFTVMLAEGRNREVRRLWESQDLKVSRLIRTRYGSLELNQRLPQGAWAELGLEDVNALRQSVSLEEETESKVSPTQHASAKLDHVRISRMRRSVKKHRLAQKRRSARR